MLQELGLFLETFKGDSRELQGYLKEVQRMFQGSFKDVLRKFQGCYSKCQVCFKKISMVFQEYFNEVLFCNFVVAWNSSHQPEQKEGLF